MAYTVTNFKTKTALKEALKGPEKIQVYQPNANITGHHFRDQEIVVIEGPHYPQPHRWYARVRIRWQPPVETVEGFFYIEKLIG